MAEYFQEDITTERHDLAVKKRRHNEEIASKLTIAFTQSDYNAFSPDYIFNVYKEFLDKLEKE